MIGDAGDDVGEPGLGVDIVHLRGFDERIQDRGAAAAGVGTGEEVVLAAEGNLPLILPGLEPKSRFIIAGTHCMADVCACITARCEPAPG